MTYQNRKRPLRKKAADRLIHEQMAREQIMCDYAIAPLDRLAIEMDNKWGIDRLPEIVSPATAARYGAAMAHLNASIEKADPAECQAVPLVAPQAPRHAFPAIPLRHRIYHSYRCSAGRLVIAI